MSLWEMFRFISSSVGITFRLVPLCVLSTLLLGIVLGIVQFKRIPVLCRIIDIYVLAMRGIPPLVVMMLLFYSVNFSSSFLAAFVALTIYHAAYITEIVRGGLASVPKGQLQAGESLALAIGRLC